MRIGRSFPAIALLLLSASSALADEPSRIQGEASIAVAYLLAGGSPFPGGHAPSTGGVAILPTGRILYRRSIVDPYLAASPIVVSPTTLKSTGFVAAVDFGAAWHPPSRAWSIGTGATFGPAYMRFCNAIWCLKQWLPLYGGELRMSGDFFRAEDGGGLSGSLGARLLTGRPTAWYWPTLSPEQADVARWIVSIGGSLVWRF
jgi:hypothetical protein